MPDLIPQKVGRHLAIDLHCRTISNVAKNARAEGKVDLDRSATIS